MSYCDVGKAAKHKGAKHPRDLRKAEPEPIRATPAAKPHKKPVKPFGMQYESKTFIRFEAVAGQSYHRLAWSWEKRTEWFKTAASRDQAMRAWRQKHGGDSKSYRNLTEHTLSRSE